MNEDKLNRLFERAREAKLDFAPHASEDFATKVIRGHLTQLQDRRFATRTSIVSIGTALVILATVIGLNFNSIDTATRDNQDPVVGLAYSLWDSGGN